MYERVRCMEMSCVLFSHNNKDKHCDFAKSLYQFLSYFVKTNHKYKFSSSATFIYLLSNYIFEGHMYGNITFCV